MKILFLALEPPYPPTDGGRIRTYNILTRIARHFPTTLVTFTPDGQDAGRLTALKGHCECVIGVPEPAAAPRSPLRKLADLRHHYPIALDRYHAPEMRAALKRLSQDHSFDVVHVNHIVVAGYVPLLKQWPVVLCHENVEAEALRRQWVVERRLASLRWWLSWLEQRRWRRFEIDISRQYDALTAVSERDAHYFRRHVPGVPVVVVPNGVDIDLYHPSVQPPDPPAREPVLLYTGSMDYPPNADAVTWFARAIWPAIRQRHPAARFLVVGRNPGSEIRALAAIPGVAVTGTVPDVLPYFERASLYVVPLRSGSGTRLKILEAMAMGLPIVSTALSCEGLDVTPGSDLLVADEPAEFASAVVGLLAHRDARARLGLQARQTAEQRYSWDAIVREQERAYELAIARQS